MSTQPFSSNEPSLVTSAKARWLKVKELESLIDPERTILTVSTSPPTSPPPSGTLLLYDRSITRNYKDDQYEWIKKRNSPKVREDHVKLRSEGKCRVAGCYVHCVTFPHMHRRAYHLLNPETGAALQPLVKNPQQTKSPSFILIHYLDTEKAAQFSQEMAKRGIDLSGRVVKSPPASKSSKGSQGKRSTSRRRKADKSPVQKKTEVVPDGKQQQQQQQQKQQHYSSRAIPQPQPSPQATPPQQDESQEEEWSFKFDEDESCDPMDFDDEMMDVLNEMALDCEDHESNPTSSSDLRKNSHSSSNAVDENKNQMNYSMDNSFGQQHHSHSDYDRQYNVGATVHSNHTQDPPSPQQQHPVKVEVKQEEVESQRVHTRKIQQKPLCEQAQYLPEIVDITPDMVTIEDDKKTKIVFSCSDKLDYGNSENVTWHTMAAFIHLSQGEGDSGCAPRIDAIDITPIQKLNPFSYLGTAPTSRTLRGNRQVALVAISEKSGGELKHNNLKSYVAQALHHSWYQTETNSQKEQNQDYVFGSISCRILSKATSNSIRFDQRATLTETKSDQSIPSNLGLGEHRTISELPAPPPAMALVATVLSDFPNPPAEAVVPPESTVTVTHVTSKKSSIPDKSISKSVGEISEGPSSEKILSKALEATVIHTGNRKRTSSSIEAPKFSATEDLDVEQISAAASAWANGRDSSSGNETKAEEVDRHCKIRFVEKLTNVIAETDIQQQDELCDLTDTELKTMDDESLDGIIDSMLVRIVESLVEMSASSCEIQEELNASDKSGFSLMHYAALYNLQALIPVLLSRGANAEVKSVRGGLTPLHLACGAGNFAIIQLLVRQGCLLEVHDSFGFTPADHAIRNGFEEIKEWLKEKMGEEREMRKETRAMEISRQSMPIRTGEYNGRRSISQDEYEESKLLIQSAFSNLSLKDKLTLNLMFKKKNQAKNPKNEKKPTIMEAEFESSCGSNNMITDEHLDHSGKIVTSENLHLNLESEEKPKAKSVTSRHSKKNISDVISESDRESLDIAMKLMNEEELEDLEIRSQYMDDDLRSWMLRRNYESLKEASMFLQNTLKKHKKEKEEKKDISDAVAKTDSVETSKKKFAENAAKRSLKNVKSQAIAGLVIRKNMSHFHKGVPKSEKKA